MTYADPYLGDLFTGGMFGGIKGDTIENVGESIGARSTTEVVADCMQYLSDKGVVIDVYCGMPMAYDQFLEKKPSAETLARKTLRFRRMDDSQRLAKEIRYGGRYTHAHA